MTVALYGTIWTALALFAAAETGRRRFSHGGNPAAWARPALLLGAALMVAHVLLALATRYGWNHEAAVQETPQQLGKNSKGTPLWGPAGAAVWSAPTIDARRGALYIGTVTRTPGRR